MRSLLLALLLAAAAGAPAAPSAASEMAGLKPILTSAELTRVTRETASALATARAVRGGFSQQRHLAGLTQPLTSSGTFLFARDVGIEWHTLDPLDSQFVLTNRGMVQRDEGGEALRIDIADQPALAVVSRVFFGLFALDFDSMHNDFEIRGDTRPGGWELLLVPRTPALRGFVRRAVVTGNKGVEKIVLEGGNGDSSVIQLRDVQFDSRGPTADERRRF